MKLATGIFKVLDRINHVFIIAAMVLVAFWMLSVSYSVVTRYVFKYTHTFFFEIWNYGLLWMTFLGIAWLQGRKGHVVVDVVVTRLKPLPQRILRTANLTLGIVVSLGLTVFGTKATWDSFQEGMRIWGTLYPPEWIVLIIIPLGSFLLLLQFLRDAYEAFAGQRGRDEEKEESISLV